MSWRDIWFENLQFRQLMINVYILVQIYIFIIWLVEPNNIDMFLLKLNKKYTNPNLIWGLMFWFAKFPKGLILVSRWNGCNTNCSTPRSETARPMLIESINMDAFPSLQCGAKTWFMQNKTSIKTCQSSSRKVAPHEQKSITLQ